MISRWQKQLKSLVETTVSRSQYSNAKLTDRAYRQRVLYNAFIAFKNTAVNGNVPETVTPRRDQLLSAGNNLISAANYFYTPHGSGTRFIWLYVYRYITELLENTQVAEGLLLYYRYGGRLDCRIQREESRVCLEKPGAENQYITNETSNLCTILGPRIQAIYDLIPQARLRIPASSGSVVQDNNILNLLQTDIRTWSANIEGVEVFNRRHYEGPTPETQAEDAAIDRAQQLARTERSLRQKANVLTQVELKEKALSQVSRYVLDENQREAIREWFEFAEAINRKYVNWGTIPVVNSNSGQRAEILAAHAIPLNTPAKEPLVQAVEAIVAGNYDAAPKLFLISGPQDSGKRILAHGFARALERTLIEIDASIVKPDITSYFLGNENAKGQIELLLPRLPNTKPPIFYVTGLDSVGCSIALRRFLCNFLEGFAKNETPILRSTYLGVDVLLEQAKAIVSVPDGDLFELSLALGNEVFLGNEPVAQELQTYQAQRPEEIKNLIQLLFHKAVDNNSHKAGFKKLSIRQDGATWLYDRYTTVCNLDSDSNPDFNTLEQLLAQDYSDMNNPARLRCAGPQNNEILTPERLAELYDLTTETHDEAHHRQGG